jgi:hypothetical protein
MVEWSGAGGRWRREPGREDGSKEKEGRRQVEDDGGSGEAGDDGVERRGGRRWCGGESRRQRGISAAPDQRAQAQKLTSRTFLCSGVAIPIAVLMSHPHLLSKISVPIFPICSGLP